MTENINFTSTVRHNVYDSTFCSLFRNPENFRELYDAITGEHHADSSQFVESRLEKTISERGIRNDVSFLVDGKLVVFVEHQSTVSPNLPLRLMLYLSRWYYDHTERELLYASKLVQIPTPELYVIYCGHAPQPKERIWQLSDAFAVPQKEPRIVFPVKQYNINIAAEQEILERSKLLREFSAFSSYWQEAKAKLIAYPAWKTYSKNEQEAAKKQAFAKVIEQCIAEDVLANYFNQHKMEVFDMFEKEWNFEEAMEYRREEAIEEERERQVCAKWKMGQAASKIADDLVLPLDVVLSIINKLKLSAAGNGFVANETVTPYSAK